MLYSAVTQPSGAASSSRGRRQGGTDFSRLAVQSTIVSPAWISTLAAADFVKPRWMEIGRNWLAARPSCRAMEKNDP
jgi:hypothetical protein